MRKKIFFDLDGTIADLYNADRWRERLHAEEEGVFKNLNLLHDAEKLVEVCTQLQDQGWEIGVITWLPRGVSASYQEVCIREKREWVECQVPFINEVHVLEFGTPKQNASYERATIEILVDDNPDVREMWETPKRRRAIDATIDLLHQLNKLLDKDE